MQHQPADMTVAAFKRILKPEAALPKIVEGRIQGFFKDVALLEQPYAKDDKLSITQLLNGASVVRYAQVEIG